MLNSKSEYNRCRVPRLRINMEEWGVKEKDADKAKQNAIDKECHAHVQVRLGAEATHRKVLV